jgi:predicted RNA-binding protein with PUA-like domain
MKYWLMKSEPNTYSVDDLAKKRQKTDGWEGVRNFQARNFMRDDMNCDDLAFFYHSSCAIPGIAGIMRIAKNGYPDLTALNPESPYYDPRSTRQNPRWFQVEVQLIQKFKHLIPLSDLKKNPTLSNMVCLRPGNRLSITPVTSNEWHSILKANKDLI